jgi:quinol-cytochrome oxidoreductase complex cytochrome b subunit
MEKPPLRNHTPFFPDLFMAEVMMTALVLVGLFLATALGYSAPLEDQANPYLTPPHAMAPWYFLFLQGLLKITPKIVGAFLVPVAIVGLLFALPYLDRGPASPRRRIWALVLAVVLFLVWAVLTYLGTPAYGG